MKRGKRMNKKNIKALTVGATSAIISLIVSHLNLSAILSAIIIALVVFIAGAIVNKSL